jgi:Ribonuclease G/E
MKCSLVAALERNSNRIDSVDKRVIEKMFNDLEVPQNSRTITITIEAPIVDADLLRDLNDRMSIPETLTEEPQKIAQDQSIIHEMDLITRKELSLKIQELKSTDNLNRISLELNAMRKQFMDDVRNQRLEFSSIEELKIAFRNLLDVQ